jgi:hypothetical protein
MTHLTPHRFGLLVAAAFGFALAAAPAAHAFTVENQDSGGAKSQDFFYQGKPTPQDPDDQVKSRFGGGQGSVQMGDSTLQFGARPSFNERYNPSAIFNQYDMGGGR